MEDDSHFLKDFYTNQVKRMNEKLDKIFDKIENLTVDVAKMPEKIIEKTDRKYAPKWTAEVLKYFMGGVTVVIIGAILQLILK